MKYPFIGGILLCMANLSCSFQQNQSQPFSEYTYYDNAQFNAYYNPDKAQIHLPNQWAYGMGNAYILRHNGTYYMYIGASNVKAALPAWKSTDLMYWEEVDNGILERGLVAEDLRVKNSYPPCVKYFNGKFYMYIYLKAPETPLKQDGNYILVADSPEGPFEFTDKNKDGEPDCYSIAETKLNIDCEIFIDDDEEMFFTSGDADQYFTGIRVFRRKEMDEILWQTEGKDTWRLKNTTIGGWTEGNGFFKRDNKYYMMYTGSSILSPGYLTHYSSAVDDSWRRPDGSYASGFENGLDWPMGVETDKYFRNLGHATSVLGPDLDALYYHYFSVNAPGPNMSFCIDRIIFNGAGMDASQTQSHAIRPRLPRIFSYAPESDVDFFEVVSERVLSKSATDSIFTIEFNYVGEGVKGIFGYRDEENYWFVQLDKAKKTIKVSCVENGQIRKMGGGTIKRDYKNGIHDCIRVAYRDGRLDIYYDDLCKIYNLSVKVASGKFGYEKPSEALLKYTAASDVAIGASDQLEPKQSFINIGAQSYLPKGLRKGYGSVLSEGSGYREITEKDSNGKQTGLGTMMLANSNDFASFIVDFKTSRTGKGAGMYAFMMTVNKHQLGKNIGLRIDGGDLLTLQIPEIHLTDKMDWLKVHVADIPISKGIHLVSLECIDAPIEFISFSFADINRARSVIGSPSGQIKKENLEFMTPGWSKVETHEEQDWILSSNAERALVYAGGKDWGDYAVEVDICLDDSVQTYAAHDIMWRNTSDIQVKTGRRPTTAGLLLRAARFSDSPWEKEDYTYIQGYYVGLNTKGVSIQKLNYFQSRPDAAVMTCDVPPHVWHKLKVIVNGNTVTAKLILNEGEEYNLKYTDDIILNPGQFGFYTDGAGVSYKAAKITDLK